MLYIYDIKETISETGIVEIHNKSQNNFAHWIQTNQWDGNVMTVEFTRAFVSLPIFYCGTIYLYCSHSYNIHYGFFCILFLCHHL